MLEREDKVRFLNNGDFTGFENFAHCYGIVEEYDKGHVYLNIYNNNDTPFDGNGLPFGRPWCFLEGTECEKIEEIKE